MRNKDEKFQAFAAKYPETIDGHNISIKRLGEVLRFFQYLDETFRTSRFVIIEEVDYPTLTKTQELLRDLHRCSEPY